MMHSHLVAEDISYKSKLSHLFFHLSKQSINFKVAKLKKIEEEFLFFPRSSASRDSSALKYFELTEIGP